ncbi:MAG: bifunctional 3-phenylpropionate/cinnamic acid dioxygenase ferredoxin subunit [Nocardioidaceae bacterium]
MARVELCRAAEVPEGGLLRVVDADGLIAPVAVANVRGEIFAVDDRCSHQEASLADGWLEDYSIECPMHESRFDLRTGEPDAPPARERVRTHEVDVVNGVVYLKDKLD